MLAMVFGAYSRAYDVCDKAEAFGSVLLACEWRDVDLVMDDKRKRVCERTTSVLYRRDTFTSKA